MSKKQPRPVAIDFETLAIEDRPCYPPKPVGVSIKAHGRKARYYGWGHVTENNCTWDDARTALREAYQAEDGLLCHNAKFDLEVAEAEFGLMVPGWQRVHDTMLLLFLDDPRAKSISLKESAQRLLGVKPEERDAVGEWLLEHQPLLASGTRITSGRGGKHYFGAYVAFAPGELVGAYCNGDVERTEALFGFLWPRIDEAGMLAAYDRERRLLPVLLRMEQRGVTVDGTRLRDDVDSLDQWFAKVDEWLRDRLDVGAEVNLDSSQQLVSAMADASVVDESLLGVTATGKLQCNKESIKRACTDQQLMAMLNYRASLKTCLGTFMRPWLTMAEVSGGKIFTRWNQVRSPHGSGFNGTRTGRLSATWFMNMPKVFLPLFRSHADDRSAKRSLPTSPLRGLPPLPNCRGYIVPSVGNVLVDRDYSQQEARILAHFDGGDLMRKYQETPRIDFHDFAKACLDKIGLHYARKPVKNTNFGLIYGMGVGALAERNNMTVDEAKKLKDAILMLYPGLKAMYAEASRRAAAGEPIRTWGGRLYYCEPPVMAGGRWKKFDYKLVNVLIQGSAADCTKEALVRLDARIHELGKQDEWFIILNVHDELVMDVPRGDLKQAMEVQRLAMESIGFDVPMLTDGDWSVDSWGNLQPYDKKGVKMYDAD